MLRFLEDQHCVRLASLCVQCHQLEARNLLANVANGRGATHATSWPMLVALFVSFSYGVSMIVGVLPLMSGISWQSHLGGAIGGVLVARLTSRATA